MDKHFDGALMLEREPIAITHWESRWFASGAAYDPGYDRATAALRRWVDGMEAALNNRKG